MSYWQPAIIALRATYLPAYNAAATYVLIKHPIRHHLYNCRENSTNHPVLFKTNPISEKTKMNISAFYTNGYENNRLRRHSENKPNSNPNKPNTKPIKANKMPKQTQYKPNFKDTEHRRLWLFRKAERRASLFQKRLQERFAAGTIVPGPQDKDIMGG
jgi:hypothetical protein